MNAFEMVSIGVMAYLGYKAFTQGIPVAAAVQDVTAAPVRRVVRRRVSA